MLAIYQLMQIKCVVEADSTQFYVLQISLYSKVQTLTALSTETPKGTIQNDQGQECNPRTEKTKFNLY